MDNANTEEETRNEKEKVQYIAFLFYKNESYYVKQEICLVL